MGDDSETSRGSMDAVFFEPAVDPCGENPFPPSDPRRNSWMRATRHAEQKLAEFTALIPQAYKIRLENEWKRTTDELVRYGRPLSPISMSPLLVPFYRLTFDSWAWRNMAAIATDADLPPYDRWLISYAESWIELVESRSWPEEVKRPLISELSDSLQAGIAHWKSEARKHLRAPDEPFNGHEMDIQAAPQIPNRSSLTGPPELMGTESGPPLGSGVTNDVTEQSTVDGPLGNNPFEKDDRRYKDWQTASRYAAEEWSRFTAEHLKNLPAESEDWKVFTEWKITSVAGLYDLRAKWLCLISVWSYEAAGLYVEALDGLLEAELSRARQKGSVGVRTEYFLSELKIRLSQRRHHWNAEALRLARDAQHREKELKVHGRATAGTTTAALDTNVAVDEPNGGKPDNTGKPGPADACFLGAHTNGGDLNGMASRSRRPRRVPNIDLSRQRLAYRDGLATELATLKPELRGYCTVEELKKRHPDFVLWSILQNAEINELLDGDPFAPKTYAEVLTMRKFGITSRETLKKDRKKLRNAQQGQRKPSSR